MGVEKPNSRQLGKTLSLEIVRRGGIEPGPKEMMFKSHEKQGEDPRTSTYGGSDPCGISGYTATAAATAARGSMMTDLRKLIGISTTSHGEEREGADEGDNDRTEETLLSSLDPKMDSAEILLIARGISHTIQQMRTEIATINATVVRQSSIMAAMSQDVLKLKIMMQNMGFGRAVPGAHNDCEDDVDGHGRSPDSKWASAGTFVQQDLFSSAQSSSATTNIVVSIILSIAQFVSITAYQKGLNSIIVSGSVFQIIKTVVNAIFKVVTDNSKTLKDGIKTMILSGGGMMNYELHQSALANLLEDPEVSSAIRETIDIVLGSAKFFIPKELFSLLNDYQVDFGGGTVACKTEMGKFSDKDVGLAISYMYDANGKVRSDFSSKMSVNEVKKMLNNYLWGSGDGTALCGSVFAGQLTDDGRCMLNLSVTGKVLNHLGSKVMMGTGNKSVAARLSRSSRTLKGDNPHHKEKEVEEELDCYKVPANFVRRHAIPMSPP